MLNNDNNNGHDGVDTLLESWSLKCADELAANVRRLARVPFLYQRAQRGKEGRDAVRGGLRTGTGSSCCITRATPPAASHAPRFRLCHW
jgi:hypothetical protein